jgi:oligopeptide transport system substrate-binding protein
MRRVLAVLMLAALLGTGSCRKQPEGAVKVLVIGNPPALGDPAAGPLSEPDEVLLANVAQGLVAFDPSGNVVSGLAERWTVSDDGLSYIFRLSPANWADGRKITAEQVARLLRREIVPRSKNSLREQLGAVDDIVAMTDRVIEISLIAPRPDLLSLLAQPQRAIIRNGHGTGPFTAQASYNGVYRLRREIASPDDETTTREDVLLAGAPAASAIQTFATGKVDMVLGGTFADLPQAQRVKLPRGSLQFDPASGLFGLVPARSGGPLDKVEVRQLLSQAIDRDTFLAALGVPGLTARATLLEPGLDGLPAPAAPGWMGTPYASRLPGLQTEANRLFPKSPKPTIAIALPEGSGTDLLFRLLQRDWGQLGFNVDRAPSAAAADFTLVDAVAPSTSSVIGRP